MAAKTKEQLKAQSDSTFFDNNEGQISPAAHRTFNGDLIDSVALQGGGGGASLDLGVQTINTSDVTGGTVSIDPVALMTAAAGGALKNGHILTVEVFQDGGSAQDVSVYGGGEPLLFAGEANWDTPIPQDPESALAFTFTYVKKGATDARFLVNASTYKQ